MLRNLQATRQKIGQVQAARLEPQTLDALLCRMVFTCYLFDRGIIDREYLKALCIAIHADFCVRYFNMLDDQQRVAPLAHELASGQADDAILLD